MNPAPIAAPAISPEAYGPWAMIFGLFVLLLIILWILLPFAVFGIRSRMERAIKLQHEQLVALQGMAASLEVLASEVQQGLQAPQAGQRAGAPPT